MDVGLEIRNQDRVVLWRTLDRAPFTIGRNPECDLCVPDEAVAPIQAVLVPTADGLMLHNRHPEGTVAGRGVVTEEARLGAGDEIQLGPLVATVRTQEQRGGKTRTLPSAAVATRPTTWVVTAPEIDPARRWTIGDGGLRAGGDATNDIVLTDPYVSSSHLSLSLEDGRCIVRDLGSRNGVFLAADEAKQKVKEAEVPPGSQVLLGKSVLVVTPELAAGVAVQSPLGVAARLVGGSAIIHQTRETIRRMARTEAPVLITGETGTGKEVAARLLVELGPRARRPYHALNCGALGRSLIESELFGHEKGAFTGATGRKAGAFELASGGTLFLDEIGELPLDLQPQLLRVVEYGEVRRVGGNESFKVDVRLIVATNRRLANEVQAGRFREDLFHRLHVLSIELPPLRQRGEDIPELARHFVETAAAGSPVTLTSAALTKLTEYDWPGNVRELRNVLQRAVLMRQGDQIDVDDLTFPPRTLADRVQAGGAISGRTLADIERSAILSELVRHKGRRADAATALGISRSTLHRKLEDYEIDIDALMRGV